jgi:hypothetical protein
LQVPFGLVVNLAVFGNFDGQYVADTAGGVVNVGHPAFFVSFRPD